MGWRTAALAALLLDREDHGDALRWLAFGVVLLPIAFIVVATVLAVPVLAALGRLRRRMSRRRGVT